MNMRSHRILGLAMAMFAPAMKSPITRLASPEEPQAPTRYDRERIAEAAAKRERKAKRKAAK